MRIQASILCWEGKIGELYSSKHTFLLGHYILIAEESIEAHKIETSMEWLGARLIAWDLVCRPRKEVGLGIIECMTWNEVSIAKYVWNIASKIENIWVKWISHIYLKGNDRWKYRPPIDSCLYWKRVCSLKERFTPGYVQNGWLRADGKYTIQSGYQWS